MKRLIATTRVDYESYRQDYDIFCEDEGIEPNEEHYLRWCESETALNWDSDLDQICDYKDYQVGVVLSGTLGLWWGNPEITPMRCASVYDAIRNILDNHQGDQEIDIYWEDGAVCVDVAHHDGTNHFIIKTRYPLPYIFE